MNKDDETVNSCPAPANLKELIQELHQVFSKDRVNVEYVRRLMTSYKSNPKDWEKYADFESDRYTRNLVDKGNGNFNLILLCWNKNQISSIHSHSDAHCFMKTLEGTIKEERFDWPRETNENSEMKHLHTNIYKKNECGYICDELGLHRMGNVSDAEKAVSLHLYSPPFQEVLSFNEKTSKSNVCRITFWSEFGNRNRMIDRT